MSYWLEIQSKNWPKTTILGSGSKYLFGPIYMSISRQIENGGGGKGGGLSRNHHEGAFTLFTKRILSFSRLFLHTPDKMTTTC